MTTNKLFLFFVTFLIFSSVVLAQPPFQVSEVSSTFSDVIVYPQRTFIQVSEDYEFNVHFLSNNSIINPSNYDCWMHLYDLTGVHVFVSEFDDNTPSIYDKYTIINESVLNKLGVYGYNVICSYNNQSSFVSGQLITTYDGNEPTPLPSSILGVFVTALLTLMIIIINIFGWKIAMNYDTVGFGLIALNVGVVYLLSWVGVIVSQGTNLAFMFVNIYSIMSVLIKYGVYLYLLGIIIYYLNKLGKSNKNRGLGGGN